MREEQLYCGWTEKCPGATKRRDERADGSVPLKLSGKSTNSLKVLPEVVVPPKNCWMKWLSWRTRILWQMSSTRLGVKDCRVPGYQFCNVHNECIRLLPVRARKLYIEHEWIISGESLLFLHYSLKVRHIIQSLWILHFNNFSYRRFISPTNRSRNLLHHRADKWTEIRTLIFWLAAYIHCMKRPERLSWRSVVSDKRKFKILVIGFSKILL